jgi:putative transposase
VIIIITTRVEQHHISKFNKFYPIIDELSFKSKNLYNYANYIIRQEFINNGKWIRRNELDKILQSHETYKELGSQAAQKTLQLLDNNWKSFFKAIKDWSKNPSKYLGRPKLPKYKDKNKGRNILMIKNIQFSIINNYIRFSWKPLQCLNGLFKTNITSKVLQARFIPKGTDYVLEIVYEIYVPETEKYNQKIIGIDIGVDNLATVSNNVGLKPFMINGRPLKSMNQYYNKRKASLQSNLKKKHDKNWSNKLEQLTTKRNNKINYYLHCSSKYIIDWCVLYDIDTLVVGHNKEWKQDSKLSKKVNQNFVQIPYNIFIQQLKYKCENNGINFIITEESYTSGSSFLDKELPIKDNYDKSRRIQRGLFQSNKGKLINSDLNGAYQIIKKVVSNAFSNDIEGVGLHPIRVNII